MRVLIVHEHYQQPGGEDAVFEAEVELLRRRGHAVATHTLHNDAVEGLGRLRLAGRTLWSRPGVRGLRRAIRQHCAEVVHLHNTFPLLSPAAYPAARAEGAAVVQTLHNYRLVCPGALLFRDGRPCEDCLVDTLPWRGVARRCYRGSTAASAATATMLALHRALGTYRRDVHAYVALTEFARERFVLGGLPAERVEVKPNFLLDDPGPGAGAPGGLLFVGRLTEEKGVRTLLEAAPRLTQRAPLVILGDGPLADEVRATAAELPGVKYLGPRPRAEVLEWMGQADALLFPSTWYEGLPMTIVEAFARGTPVVGSDLGAMRSLIADGETGARFVPGNPVALAEAVERIWPERLALRRGARSMFEARFTPEANGERLEAIYARAQARAAQQPMSRLKTLSVAV